MRHEVGSAPDAGTAETASHIFEDGGSGGPPRTCGHYGTQEVALCRFETRFHSLPPPRGYSPLRDPCIRDPCHHLSSHQPLPVPFSNPMGEQRLEGTRHIVGPRC